MTIQQAEWLTVSQFKDRHPYLGLNKIYDEARSGGLASITVGTKVLIRSDALDLLLEKQQSENDE